VADAGVPAAGLTEEEWAAIEAIRREGNVAAAAASVAAEEPAFRRRLSLAGEKLRMASAIPPDASPADGRFHVPHLEPCPFCENFAGRFSTRSGPPAVIYEDDLVYVFLAPAPLGGMPGHTLVTTRRHVQTIFDLSTGEASTLGATVARTARMLRSAVQPEGLLVQQNNGAAAFQTVPHIHFHVIPKVAGPFPPHDPPQPVPAEERSALAQELRRHW